MCPQTLIRNSGARLRQGNTADQTRRNSEDPQAHKIANFSCFLRDEMKWVNNTLMPIVCQILKVDNYPQHHLGIKPSKLAMRACLIALATFL